MKSFTAIAATAALLSTAYGATVKIEETPCMNSNTELKTFEVTIGTPKVGAIESVCGLKIVSADGADVNKVMCQAFKDAEGLQDGSSTFTFDKPALIATNPVQEGSIQCNLFGGDASASPTGTAATTMMTASPSGTGSMPYPTGGNGTSPGSPTKPGSPSGSPPPQNENMAGRIGLSLGALALGVAAFVL